MKPARFLTAVFRAPDGWKPGDEIMFHPNLSAASWSHALDDRDKARAALATAQEDADRWHAFRARDEFDDLDFTAFRDQFREDADAVIDRALHARTPGE